MKIVASTRTPFGIRSGGHATNQGFSSTPGVQIALFKLSEIVYHAAPLASDGSIGTVEFGSGLVSPSACTSYNIVSVLIIRQRQVWDDVYAALDPLGANVVGGRVTGVGVAGLILGGGYSWLSNQHGLVPLLFLFLFYITLAESLMHRLTIDTVTAFEVVLPSGAITTATETSNTDLFFGLKARLLFENSHSF
jgi:hypothetical protein